MHIIKMLNKAMAPCVILIQCKHGAIQTMELLNVSGLPLQKHFHYIIFLYIQAKKILPGAELTGIQA